MSKFGRKFTNFGYWYEVDESNQGQKDIVLE